MEQTYKKIDMDTAVSMLKDHQLWLSSGGKEGKQAVFTGYDLSGLDSDYAEARYVVPPFWEKNLSKIDLSHSNLSDLNYMKDVKLVYHDCNIYGDKGYIGADVQLDLFQTAHIRLECPYRLNQKNWKPKLIPFAKARKRIETLFSQLTDQFLVIRNYAKITNGLFVRIIGKISALTILQYVNFINNKPIGRIKYALN